MGHTWTAAAHQATGGETMSVLSNWRMQAAMPVRSKRIGLWATSYSTVARVAMGGRLVVDLPAMARIGIGLEAGVRVWFSLSGEGLAVTRKPRGPRGTKRHSSRILTTHMPLRLRLPRQRDRPHQCLEKLVSE